MEKSNKYVVYEVSHTGNAAYSYGEFKNFKSALNGAFKTITDSIVDACILYDDTLVKAEDIQSGDPFVQMDVSSLVSDNGIKICVKDNTNSTGYNIFITEKVKEE